MDRRSANRLAIENALPTVATVICSIINDYVIEEIHTFDSTVPVRIIAGPFTAPVLKPKIINAGTSQKIIHRDTDEEGDFVWHTYVSAVNFGTAGARRWSVGSTRETDSYGDIDGWIGCGVTTASGPSINFADACYEGVSTDDSWIVRDSSTSVCYAGRQETPMVCADGQIFADDWPPIADDLPLITGCPRSSWIQFSADRDRLRVFARFGGRGPVYIVMTSSTVDDFDKLRPAVVLAGQVAATVVSDVFS